MWVFAEVFDFCRFPSENFIVVFAEFLSAYFQVSLLPTIESLQRVLRFCESIIKMRVCVWLCGASLDPVHYMILLGSKYEPNMFRRFCHFFRLWFLFFWEFGFSEKQPEQYYGDDVEHACEEERRCELSYAD